VPAATEPVVQPTISLTLPDSINGRRAPIVFETVYNRDISFDRPSVAPLAVSTSSTSALTEKDKDKDKPAVKKIFFG